jgi:hypothetical protein
MERIRILSEIGVMHVMGQLSTRASKCTSWGSVGADTQMVTEQGAKFFQFCFQFPLLEVHFLTFSHLFDPWYEKSLKLAEIFYHFQLYLCAHRLIMES